MVRDLVVSYMKQKRSIILAVVAADSAFANQPVTQFARKIDDAGTRTLGLITKPDKIDRGSEAEKYYSECSIWEVQASALICVLPRFTFSLRYVYFVAAASNLSRS